MSHEAERLSWLLLYKVGYSSWSFDPAFEADRRSSDAAPRSTIKSLRQISSCASNSVPNYWKPRVSITLIQRLAEELLSWTGYGATAVLGATRCDWN